MSSIIVAAAAADFPQTGLHITELQLVLLVEVLSHIRRLEHLVVVEVVEVIQEQLLVD
jgi:hypothetical protein